METSVGGRRDLLNGAVVAIEQLLEGGDQLRAHCSSLPNAPNRMGYGVTRYWAEAPC